MAKIVETRCTFHVFLSKVNNSKPKLYSIFVALCYSSQSKADIPAEIQKCHFYKLCDQYADYCRIYTDGSKAGERVASAIVYKGITKSVRLPDLISIFRAELYALFLAVDVIRRSKLK